MLRRAYASAYHWQRATGAEPAEAFAQANSVPIADPDDKAVLDGDLAKPLGG
jgi:hypothetical protein